MIIILLVLLSWTLAHGPGFYVRIYPDIAYDQVKAMIPHKVSRKYLTGGRVR